ncbi:FAD-dependent oxidoreductase [Clostridium perfringens]|uniref:FAD-dependent oxidoreductase n=1 Tax=Clostridium perfringens TaxID=1502 RepID=UPI0018E4CD4A|nr:FAD-dependent oxidoreductase [Clostridium perfringens]EHK2304780.1 FAD-dependent oxidoreductase [Clostridium perfringens]MBI6082813.1 FAD-dependent oxidoreductase [Clostridium perfringens]MBI6102521.1 FAD-dependent oxidoreductase [Clostridium perfringens]MDK0605913.1 FAD-dependent oxidoreductase [Clostridium perfringens]MDK0647053.1 FAD-dependent oxidoreductase [Clostridium perfringens]
MNYLEVKKDIYWVGSLDPELRVFDIIMYTPYGTTYNSYVVKGSEKIAVFETVKEKCFDDYLSKLNSLGIDPKSIDYIVVDHTEPDHAGSVEKLLELSPKAKVIGSMQAIEFLKDIVNKDFEYIVVGDNDTISLGNKTLQFISAPFLHWPDSMYTYIPEDKALITCDSFGSHYSCKEVFNDLVPNEEEYLDALRYYYDCIFGPYKPYVLKAIDKIKDLDIELVCPGHGPILRQDPWKIINTYKEWSTPVKPKINGDKKVTIPYVSAYGYTKELAEEIAKGIQSEHNVEVKLYDLTYSKQEDVLADIGESDGILFGSPTIVGELLPPIRILLANLNPIIHGGKYAAAFGSFGWSGEAVPRIEARLKELKMNIFGPGLRIKFKPSTTELKEAFEFGRDFSRTMFGEKELDYAPNNATETKEVLTGNGKTRYWKCLVCGEIFESPVCPEVCPVCGAGKEQFIEVEMDTFEKNDTDDNFVIIGNGAAGFYAAKTIREINSTASVKLLSSEEVSSYSRPNLSDLLNEEMNLDTFYLAKSSWYKENNIEELLGVTVTSIDKDAKKVILKDGTEIPYTKLILANGSHNFIPPFKVKNNNEEVTLNCENIHEFKGIYSIKDLKDTFDVKEEMKEAKKAVVIGAGPLGLEAAWEMKLAGLEVTVVEFLPNLMNNQLDQEGADIFKNQVSDCGITFITSEECAEIITKDGKLTSLNLKSGKTLDADILIVSTGIRSNIELAKETGIECNRGVIVNERMETSVKDIYACGDVAEFNGLVYGNWPAAIEMGKTAGANACEAEKAFENFTPSIILDALNTHVFSAGLIRFNDSSYEKISSKDESKGQYTKLFFKDNILVGGIIVGDISKAGQIIIAIDNKLSKAAALSNDLL